MLDLSTGRAPRQDSLTVVACLAIAGPCSILIVYRRNTCGLQVKKGGGVFRLGRNVWSGS